MQNATTRRVRSGPKMSENAQILRTDVLSHQNLRPYPQSTPKPHFGDRSMQSKVLYTEVTVSRTLMELRAYEAETLQLYRYMQVLWGMGVSKFFR